MYTFSSPPSNEQAAAGIAPSTFGWEADSTNPVFIPYTELRHDFMIKWLAAQKLIGAYIPANLVPTSAKQFALQLSTVLGPNFFVKQLTRTGNGITRGILLPPVPVMRERIAALLGKPPKNIDC